MGTKPSRPKIPLTGLTLVTGGTGFLGKHVLAELKNSGDPIICLTRGPTQEYIGGNIFFVSMAHYADLKSDLNVKQVLHLATNYGRGATNPSKVLDANLFLPIRILSNHIDSISRFVNIDSYFTKTEVLQQYLWQYSLSKRHALEWLERLSEDIEFHNVFLEHIFGPGDSPAKFAPWLLDTLRRAEPVHLRSGSQLRDWIYVKDAARAIALLLQAPLSSNTSGTFTHELGTGETYTVLEFAEVVARAVGSASEIILGALPNRVNEIPTSCADNRSLRELGWSPVYSLEGGVREFVESS